MIKIRKQALQDMSKGGLVVIAWNDDTLGGALRFGGTRLSLENLVSRLSKGEAVKSLKKDYPYMRHEIEFAQKLSELYAPRVDEWTKKIGRKLGIDPTLLPKMRWSEFNKLCAAKGYEPTFGLRTGMRMRPVKQRRAGPGTSRQSRRRPAKSRR